MAAAYVAPGGVPALYDRTMPEIDRDRLTRVLERERVRYGELHPGAASAAAASASLLFDVPMPWMRAWRGGPPPTFRDARGAHLVDSDDNEYVDFCLGDTGAMAGHSPAPTVAAIRERVETRGGLTTMLPTDDGAAAGGELARRFGLPRWSFTVSATDANRNVIRMARQVTGRPRILVFNYCYHGSVDETFATLRGGRVEAREGNVGAPVPLEVTTRVCEFDDLGAVERELAHCDVACVLTEPALTNIGIVLPGDGFHARLRELCDAAGTLLVIDETHTFSAGPGGCTAAWGLSPDVVTIGKSIGGGIPVGAYGVTEALAQQMAADPEGDYQDVGGIGGTLAGNALSLAAVRATLGEVLTADAFERMLALGARFAAGVQDTLDRRAMPWCVVRLGARAELRFCPAPPASGAASAAAHDAELDEWYHLVTFNRGLLMTPFHNMALMCPATVAADVDRHTEVFDEAVAELLA